MKPRNYVSILLFTVLIVFANVACTPGKTEAEQPETNAALANIFARKSVRTYRDRPVEQEKIDLMLRAGMAAPSGMNVRPWHFVVVNECAVLDSMAAALPYAKMLSKTNQAIVVCGDPERSSYWYLDCSAAAQNILLAAESLGLGAVWTAAYPYDDRMNVVGRHLGLPGNILPLCVIPFGYPAGTEQPKDKFDPSRIHYNRF